MSDILIYYKVIESDYIPSLESEVTPFLHDGYELVGGVSAYSYRDSIGDLHVYYCQTLIKKATRE